MNALSEGHKTLKLKYSTFLQILNSFITLFYIIIHNITHAHINGSFY